MARDAAGFVNYFTILRVRRFGIMQGLREYLQGSGDEQKQAAESQAKENRILRGIASK
jgi:hypothetical protein